MKPCVIINYMHYRKRIDLNRSEVTRSTVNQLETQESWWCRSSPNGGKPRTQEGQRLQFKSEGKQRPMSSSVSLAEGIPCNSAFVFCSDIQLIGLSPFPLREGNSLYLSILLEMEMVTYTGIPAWRIPWTEEPGRLQAMGSQRVRHDWATKQQNILQRHSEQCLSKSLGTHDSFKLTTQNCHTIEVYLLHIWERICLILYELGVPCDLFL